MTVTQQAGGASPADFGRYGDYGDYLASPQPDVQFVTDGP